MGETTAGERLRVRVWFGQVVIVDRTTTPELAAHFVRAMDRRFAGLPITVDPATEQANDSTRPEATDGLSSRRAAL